MPPPRPASLKTSKFEEGEAVLCFQGILIYEAKVQSVQKEGSSFLYDIHYKVSYDGAKDGLTSSMMTGLEQNLG